MSEGTELPVGWVSSSPLRKPITPRRPVAHRRPPAAAATADAAGLLRNPDRRKPRPGPGPARSPSSPAPSNGGELPPLPPGADVEVRIDGRGFFGNWYAATVIRYDPARGRRSKARYTDTYTDLLDDDHGGALTERFAPTHVRPRPPHPESPPRFLLYDKVEAFHNDGWWSGIVFSTAPESVTVAFPITREVLSFSPDLVRPRRDYIGGSDWVPSTAVVTVWRKGEVGVYEVGEKVKVWKKRHFFLGTVIKLIDDLSYLVEYSDLGAVGLRR
nr:unnamed protein product [Digitaria exilis]